MCLSSTGLKAIAAPPLRSEAVEDRVDHLHQQEQEEDRDDRREIERPEGRQQPPEEAQIRLTDIAEKVLDPAQPGRVRQPDPRRQDVDEDQEDVDPDEVVDEAIDRRRRVVEQQRSGAYAHSVIFGSAGAVPTTGLALRLVEE